MAKRKATTTRVATKPAKKRPAKATSKKSRGGAKAARKKAAGKKKVSRAAKVKKANRAVKKVVTKKVAAKKAAKVAKRSRVVKKVAAPPRANKAKPAAKTAKKKTASRNTAPPPSAHVSLQWGSTTIELVEEGKRVPRTKLTKKELRGFAAMLLAKRRELVGDMNNLGNEALNSKHGGGGSSSVPLHMADVGSDNWEQEFTLGLIENERSLVQEIDDALARIEARTYGICLATHTPIDKARLRAKPWAKYCIEYARLRELGRVP